MKKKLMTIQELVKEGFPQAWLYQVARSDDFIEAGGRRLAGKNSTIYFDPERLDRYFEQQTILHS